MNKTGPKSDQQKAPHINGAFFDRLMRKAFWKSIMVKSLIENVNNNLDASQIHKFPTSPGEMQKPIFQKVLFWDISQILR